MEWNNNAPYVLCLSHDVDRICKQWYHYGYYGIKQPIVQIKSLMEKLAGDEPYWNFERLMTLEDDFGVRSTFFFLNESRKEWSPNFMGRYNIQSGKVKRIIRELDQNGWEIGLHGSYDSYCNLELLRQEKAILEEIVGHSVVSTRQHHLNYDKRTWLIHKSIGIKYDSTMGYSQAVGKGQPLRTDENIVEMPITLMDTVALTEDVYEECCIVADTGGMVMLNFHQCHFNEVEYPRNVFMYKRLLEKAKKDGAWITNVRDAGEWLDKHFEK